MRKILNVFKEENIVTGYLYFYIHFVVEVICFFVLARLVGDSPLLWFMPLFYDALAFCSQGVIGYVSDRFPNLKVGIIGLVLLIVGFLLFGFNLVSSYISVMLVGLGNAFIHVDGAEVTLHSSKGKLAHSAIFVSGGSFGVITGKLIGSSSISFILITLLGLSTIPFILLADTYREDRSCLEFNCVKNDYKGSIVIILAMIIVAVRSYMGYGIPTSWNKTVYQAIILYVFMGLGKALGGILADAYGIKKVAILSSLLALPFLLIGDNIMVVSLIGVLFFSMTMAITLSMLVSVLKHSPGLAFGLTTIGLFLGSVPVFFFRISNFFVNGAVIVILSMICLVIFKKILKDGV